MSSPTYILDGSADNFGAAVLENSTKGPVLVNFWAPWAGPCLKLWPVLEKLAADYSGKFLLVNVNTDRHKALAREYGVNSLPTLKIFRHGRVVDQVHGAESERLLRQWIDRHLPRASDAERARAVGMLRGGDAAGALAILQQAARDDPDNPHLGVDQAKILIQLGRLTEAETVLAGLPAAQREEGQAAGLLAHVGFLQAAQQAPPAEALRARIAAAPDDLEARYQLSAVRLLADDYEGALEQLLEIVQRDRAFRRDVGRRSMAAVFGLLGHEHALSVRYRPLLTKALH